MTSIPSVRPSATQKSAELKQEIDRRLDILAKAVDQVRASELFKQYLAVQSRFHHYSWHNSWLIAMQCPDATRVAGYRAWQALGRQVRKGEKGIRIFAPCPFKRETTSQAGETESIEGMFFKAVSVFDISQTDGEELPEFPLPDVECAADNLLSKLIQVAHHRGIAVQFKNLGDGLFGVSKGGSIDVDCTHPTGQQAKTLAHELAHEILHKTNRGALTRNMAELEAESVAYVVCLHFGLDVEVRASHYIALWNGNSKALRESLDRISKTIRSIIDDCSAIESRKAVA